MGCGDRGGRRAGLPQPLGTTSDPDTGLDAEWTRQVEDQPERLARELREFVKA